MAVKIKLKRMGKIRSPHYRIIVADSRTRRDGRAIEEIGLYNPMVEPSLIKVDSERVQYWLGAGAQPTEPVMAILKVTGDWQTFKGLPGAEGTLKVKEAAADRNEVFNALLAEAHGTDQAEATTPRKRTTRKSTKPAEKKAEAKDAETKDSETKDAEVKDAEVKDAEAKDAEAKDAEAVPSEATEDSSAGDGQPAESADADPKG